MMNTSSFALYMLLGCALTISLLAIPLILGRVGRNRWYGFRTQRTLSSDRVWFAANQSMGWAVFWNGLAMMALTILLYLTLPALFPMLVLVYIPVSTAVLWAYGAHKLDQLEKEPPDSAA